MNTFTQDWIIKVKVVKKYPMKTWSNPKGEGKLFSMDLMDRENTQIQATLFKEAADKWYPLIEEGKIYSMADGQVKMANKRFSTIPHDHCLGFETNSAIYEIQEDVSMGSTIVGNGYNFTSLRAVKEAVQQP